MARKEPILIVGGGIGGCILGIALLQRGIPFHIFEKKETLKEIGAGLSLWPNATRTLNNLGLQDAIGALAGPSHAFGLFSSTGRAIARDLWKDVNERFGSPLIVVHRAELLRMFMEKIPPELFHRGSTCAGFWHDSNDVLIRLSDGREYRGSALVGADGIHSAVRRLLKRPTQTRHAGYTAWRAVTPIQRSGLSPSGNWCGLYLGEGTQIGLAPIRNSRLYWFATRNIPEGIRPSSRGHLAELLESFGHWPEPIVRTIAHLQETEIIRNDIIDLPPIKQWGKGRVTLMGDAAHAATPDLGQGACMAIEDAAVLAARLSETDDFTSALRAYERDRVQRTLRVAETSRRVGQALQLKNPVLCHLRDFALSIVPPRARIEALSWLLDYDTSKPVRTR